MGWIVFSPNPNIYLLTPINISIYLVYTGIYLFLIIIVTGSFLRALNVQANTEHDNYSITNYQFIYFNFFLLFLEGI